MNLSEGTQLALHTFIEGVERDTGVEVTEMDLFSHARDRKESVDIGDVLSKGFEQKTLSGTNWMKGETKVDDITVGVTCFLDRGIDIGYFCEGEDCHEKVDEEGMCDSCQEKAFQTAIELEAEYRASAI